MSSEKNNNDSGPRVLALDTTSKATSLALFAEGRTIAALGVESDRRRSERLWTEVEFLLDEAALKLEDIDLFAVCTGPGGFTGLRIGVAAIKGFALATGRRAVGVTSLEAAAMAAAPAPVVCALIGAYKGEVYSQLFSFDEDDAPVAESEPSVGGIAETIEQVTEIDDIVFAGDALAESLETIEHLSGNRQGWQIKRTPSFMAESIARLAVIKAGRGLAVTASELRACYVRRAEAEIKLSLGLLGSKIRRITRAE
ncbi:MAG: tRNA (adenosine(37)-N6)-threonylcarbamoyltransferase complex dimerization subunit type 1 TsaB [Acidobacteriota bacterium]